MATLSTVALILKSFYRLVGTISSDDALVENGESADDVAYLCLNFGIWRAQHFLIRSGMANRWRTRGSAITSWTGTDDTTGGRYTSLPADLLRLAGDRHRSALVKANGDAWGQEVSEEERDYRGDFYYVKNDQLWLGRQANVPNPIYIEYHHRHAEFKSDTTIDFPVDARPLIVSEAAAYAAEEGWFPQDMNGTAKIEKRLKEDRREAYLLARRSRAPRRMNIQPAIGTRYIV